MGALRRKYESTHAQVRQTRGLDILLAASCYLRKANGRESCFREEASLRPFKEDTHVLCCLIPLLHK